MSDPTPEDRLRAVGLNLETAMRHARIVVLAVNRRHEADAKAALKDLVDWMHTLDAEALEHVTTNALFTAVQLKDKLGALGSMNRADRRRR